MIRAHGNRIDTGCLDQLCGGDRIRQGNALRFAVFRGIEFHPNRVFRAHGCAHRSDDLEQKTGPVLEAATVFILTLVCVRGKESRNDVTVPGMNLHAVHAGFLCPSRGVSKPPDEFRDVFAGHRMQFHLGAHPRVHLCHLTLEHHLEHVDVAALGVGRNQQWSTRGTILHGDNAAMMQLQCQLCAMGVHGVRQHTDSGYVPIFR